MRFATALFLISWVALAGSKPEPVLEIHSEALFRAYHFKAAARKFEEAQLPELAIPSAAHKNVYKAHRARITPQSCWGASVSAVAARQHDDARYDFVAAGPVIRGGRRLLSLIRRLVPRK